MTDVDEEPTPDTVRMVAEVLKMAAILDDRVAQADRSRILGWSKQVQRHPGLTREDLLAGLHAFYDGPSERPIQVGDLISRAKQAKRDRVEREDAASREERRVEWDQKVADETTAIASGFVGGTADPTPRLEAAREALQMCVGKEASMRCIKEFFAAKKEAQKGGKR